MDANKLEELTNLKHQSSHRNRRQLKLVIDNLTEYTANTTLHGIKYLGWKKQPVAEKIYWIIIFVICLILFGFFLTEIISKWTHKFVVLVEDDTPTPIHEIPFPAVTICPQHKIKKSEFSYRQFYDLHQQGNIDWSAFQDYLMRFQLAQQICSYKTINIMSQEFYSSKDFLNKSHIELLHEISPKFVDIFNSFMSSSCKAKLSSLKLSSSSIPITADTFSTVLTSSGVCFTLNLDPNIIRSENIQNEYLYLNVSRNNKGLCSASDISRIKIYLYTKVSDMDSLCQPTHPGYKIILHSPEIYPTTFENYIAINHESMTQIKVQPKMITTSETLRSYTPKQRQCYFTGERQLKFFRFYNRANCKLECFANYTLQVYGCVHFALPRGPDNPICGQPINYAELYEMIDSFDSLLTYYQEYPEKTDKVLFQNAKEMFPSPCDCLSECNSIEYDYTTIVENFSYDKIVKEIGSLWKGGGPESPAEFEIVWKSSKFQGTIRKQFYTFSDLVSHFGGLLGLFMGASILSIFEIIYFCVIRHFTKKY